MKLSTNLNGYEFKYDIGAFNYEIYLNDANGDILDPDTQKKVGKIIKTIKGIVVPKSGYYKITDKKWLERHMPIKDPNKMGKLNNIFKGKVLN